MSPLKTPRTTLARRIVIWGSVALIGGVLLAYMLFQARFLIVGPRITLTDKPAILQETQKIVLSGRAENIVAITMNGRPMVTDQDGNFSVPVVLSPGYSIVQLTARDRFGRTTTLTKSFVYTTPYTTITYQTEPPQPGR